MNKIIKKKGYMSNLGLGILNYAYAWSKPCAHILDDAYTPYSKDLKNNIFY